MVHILFSLSLVAIYRFVLGSYILLVYKKKEYIAIKKRTTFWDNWFLFSLTKEVKDRYSRYEQRTIRYSRHARAFWGMNLTHHLLLIFEFLLWLMAGVLNDAGLKEIAEICSIFLYCVIGLSFILFAFVTCLENKRYHKKRLSR